MKRKKIEKSIRARMAVFRSNKYIYAQIIDDAKEKTLAASSDLKYQGKDKGKKARAVFVGEDLAEKAIKKGLKKVRFDRRKYKYHGRIKILAEAARKKGLEF